MTGPKRIYFSNYRHSTSRAQHHGTILDQPDGRYHCQLIILLGVLDKSILINWVCNWALADWTRTVTLHMLNLSSAYGGDSSTSITWARGTWLLLRCSSRLPRVPILGDPTICYTVQDFYNILEAEDWLLCYLTSARPLKKCLMGD